MRPPSHRARNFAEKFAALPSSILLVLAFLAVALTHRTLLHLSYFWDEGGYYIPAALDFYHTGQLVPHFTNAHPPLPNILLGTLWHIVGYHILASRLLVCAFAASGLVAIFRLSEHFLDASAALSITLLTAIYPIWFAQSTLAHADIFAAAFTLWAFVFYFVETKHSHVWVAILFSLAALSKETSILQPAALAAVHLARFIQDRHIPTLRRNHLKWITALSFPLLPLATWFAYHHHVTGFTFGNPEYLRYNATANLTSAHILQALRYRFLHLFWQRNIWLPILFAVACLFLPRRAHHPASLSPGAFRIIVLLVVADWLAFSILGGALLTRYLLPIYPLILLVCVDVWRTRTSWWPVMVLVTASAFLSALWLNPPAFFAPEDNLTYRDMVVVDQQAINFVAQQYPNATVLTAWPVAADIVRPELGYVSRPLKSISIEDFTLPQIRRASKESNSYDTAIVFTTHFVTPSFRAYLLAHPNSRHGQAFAANRDLTPTEIAAILGGHIVWQNDIHGEWAAVLRFNRSYAAQLASPRPLSARTNLLPARLIP